MYLTCPSCTTRFVVDRNQFGPRPRDVRCAKCGEVWTAEPNDDQLPDVYGAPEDQDTLGSGGGAGDFDTMFDEQPDELVSARNARLDAMEGDEAPLMDVSPRNLRMQLPGVRTADDVGPKKPLLEGPLGWGLVLVVMAGVLVGLVTQRDRIITAAPRFALLYEAIGMPGHPPTWAFQGVGHQKRMDGETLVLTVTGLIANTGKEPAPVPPIAIFLRDKDRQVLAALGANPKPDPIPPGRSVPFATRVPNPPEGVVEAVVRLAETGDTLSAPAAIPNHTETPHSAGEAPAGDHAMPAPETPADAPSAGAPADQSAPAPEAKQE